MLFQKYSQFFCYCFECITIILISFRKCFQHTLCYLCNNEAKYNCCNYKCCSGTSCCCCDTKNFEQNEISFCLCYQEKRKLEWFDDYLNNKAQKLLVFLVCLIAFFKTFTIGLEEIYKKKCK